MFVLDNDDDDEGDNEPSVGVVTSSDDVVATFLLHSLDTVHTEGYVTWHKIHTYVRIY